MNENSKNLFISLFNQKKENFLTESLSYFLINSLKEDKELIGKFLALLDCQSCQVKEIETQKHFPKNNSFIDLVITLNTNELLLIEVKYESGLNEYEIESEQEKTTINQLEKYSKIDERKKLYLLSIDDYSDNSEISDFKNHIYWYQIFEIFNTLKNKSSLTNEFVEFMTSIGNNLRKVSFNIEQSSQTVFALLSMLERAVKKNGLFKKNSGFSSTSYYLGFYIYPSDSTLCNIYISSNNFIWVGFSEKYPNQLTFQVSDKRINNEPYAAKIDNLIKDDFSIIKHKCELRISPFVFKDSFYDKEPVEQLNTIESWLKQNVEHLKKLYISIGI